MKVGTRGQKIRNLLPTTLAGFVSVWNLEGVPVDGVWDETTIRHCTMPHTYFSVMKLGL